MSEEIDSSNETESVESPEANIPEMLDVMEEEPKIEEMIYGKNKPRRMTIDRKIIYD